MDLRRERLVWRGGGVRLYVSPVATKRPSSPAAAERKRQREAEEAAAARQRARDRAADDEAPRRMGQVRGGKG
jgi:hypothetical protein